MNNNVSHPNHYTQLKNKGIQAECIDVIEAMDFPHHVACAFKYIWRYRDKNGLEDLRKAVWYLQRYCDLHDPATTDVPPRINADTDMD